ncbi:flagellar biosynthesis repressor FlbT [Trichlorobacter ammonificans]|uniref:Flagellum biosynthesis repressor protein FlbT 1 n=1 Tax=Trichlorobacter ammonificans TaxID=2916410 RepID=A0ABM9DBJ3_9BACT|nr:flagellar biosynthesis repressor FlbT [Trichlorobacter ammonificans]CAH2032601.1 putative flagellum biosynthesis repressor protein FlbT 1 [Trichlorobacter ammonificans]
MPLKLNLKADERVIIGGAVIRNGGKHAELFIENNVPILREKDIMPEEAADTPAKRLYFTLQLIYIDAENRPAHIEYFFTLAHDLMEAAPSTRSYISAICDQITVSRFYQALKIAHTLIEYEKELTTHVEPVHGSL